MMFFAAPEELESYYPVRPECQADVPKTRFKARVGKTLSQRRWNAAISPDGHLDIADVLRRIQRGGVHPLIKGSVWEFLLVCFDPNSTHDIRNDIRQRRREQYATWKDECQKMVPMVGSGKFITAPIIGDDGKPLEDSHEISKGCSLGQNEIQWMQNLPQIGLDVVRTDRTLVFYVNEANQAKLWDVLAVYAWRDTAIGYVQGMNDICSPMIMLFEEEEADAFWCFEHTMRRLRENFRCTRTSMGVQSQLTVLAQIIKAIDPKLHQHLEELDGGEYLFAIRMLMVLFRREFSFVDALYLLEAMEYNPNIYSLYEASGDLDLDSSGVQSSGGTKVSDKQLKQYGKFERNNLKTGLTDQRAALAVFLVAGVLETKNKRLLQEAQGMGDVVKILGEITGNLDAKKALKETLKVHKKYLSKTSFSLQFYDVNINCIHGLIDIPETYGLERVKYSFKLIEFSRNGGKL